MVGELEPVDDELRSMAETFMHIDRIIVEKKAMGQVITATDTLMDRPVHVKHAAWKLGENSENEIWINGRLGVVFSTGLKIEGMDMCSRAFYILQGEPEGESREALLNMTLNELARWHLAWLTDPNVFIDSATIDMEYNAEMMIEKRTFRIKHLNISVQSNYNAIDGWLQLMETGMESFIFRGNGILDSNRFLQLPFVSRLKKLMIIHESSFDDRTLNLLNAQHIQLASDFISDVGINKLLVRWNEQNYPIRSTFVIYCQIKNREAVVAKLDVQETVHNDNGVSEYLIQMTNPAKRMRVIARSSSVICTVFAVSNCLPDEEKPENPEKL